jgi:hypothetical protein
MDPKSMHVATNVASFRAVMESLPLRANSVRLLVEVRSGWEKLVGRTLALT